MLAHSPVIDSHRVRWTVPEPSSPDTFTEVLQLRLRWNDEYEQLAARMFQFVHDQTRVESLADEVDVLRQRAADASRKLLREIPLRGVEENGRQHNLLVGAGSPE